MRLFCFVQEKTLCMYGCIYFLAPLVLVCVNGLLASLIVSLSLAVDRSPVSSHLKRTVVLGSGFPEAIVRGSLWLP